MGSEPFDLRKRAPEQKKGGRKFKLPRLIAKFNLLKVGIGAAILAVPALYIGLNTYTVDEDEVVYAVNHFRPSNRVSIDEGEGIKIPFTDERVHLPWPLGGSSSAAGWPFGGHAVVPLTGNFVGTIQGPMYNTQISLSYSVDPHNEVPFAVRYGPAAFGTNALERWAESGWVSDFGDVAEVIRADGKNVDAASAAAIDDITNALWFVLRGKSVEKINEGKADPVYMAYLMNEVEELLPLIEIDGLRIDSVSRKDNVISVTTAEGFSVDTLITYVGSRSGLSSSKPAIDTEAVQRVFGRHFLMELRTGELPDRIYEELCAELGIDGLVDNSFESDSRKYTGLESRFIAGSQKEQRSLVVDLGNAQDQFYRTFFNSGILHFEKDMAAAMVAAGDLEGAVDLYTGMVEYSSLFPLSKESNNAVVEAKFSLGIIYEDLSTLAYAQGDQKAEFELKDLAAEFFMDFLESAPKAHREYDAVVSNLFNHYGRHIDFSEWRLLSEEPEPIPEVTAEPTPIVVEVTPGITAEPTPIATPIPLEAHLEPEFNGGGCDGVFASIENTGDAQSNGGERYYMFREAGKFIEGYLDPIIPGDSVGVTMPYDGPGIYHLRIEGVFDKTVSFNFSCEVPAATSPTAEPTDES